MLERAKAQATPQTENPLRVLGLGQSILTTGLSDDDIFELAQILAKRILLRLQ